ncbi:hypothetical protein F5Y00DRAFT_72095 [Daldinia vernicosa]|uniref:uncharacterized protein n=1 Tax=Daldinia vernicosa TaxID=114800 RepID=UPI0020072ED8|nr:uncharacterized protein F5Y00DRAFT_72095 [Daldinia vernicosa]KAI0849020.1 hypothetical protein F5Y00DRAFT_72095 [Daldinia vernicosa]
MATSAATMSSAYLNGHSKPQPTKLSITPISAASSPASAASPISSVSTPTSNHQLAIKPAAAAAALQATAMASKASITSKEWVVPPRPKPGRKPATDTPPTKRKAQNRAAQRAFRERRAARVGELEEQLEEQKEEYERNQQQLTDQVQDLDAEVLTLRNRCLVLEDLLEKERKERIKVASELEDLRRRWRGGEDASTSSRHGSFAIQHGRLPNPLTIASQHPTPRGSLASNASDHRNSATAFSISQIISPPDSSSPPGALRESSTDLAGCGNCEINGPCACAEEVLADTAVGCNKCSIGSKCECLEAMVKDLAPNSESELKRKKSSLSVIAPEEKRQKIPEPYPHEVDFTAAFAKKKDPVPEPVIYQAPTQPTVPPRDSCGFCEEGTYCMCAEAAASQTLPPVSQQVQTPPPSENDVGPHPIEITSTGAVKLPGINSLSRTPIPTARPSGGCGPKGPGSCAQCLNDPKSGLFCRSLAASFSRNSGTSSGGCCGGSGGSGCCKSTEAGTSTDSPAGINLSCAEAYKTLSSHRNFDKAADEIGTWLPRLKAAPLPANTAGRPPIEVQVASIMGVLREFDVRFGREA